MELNAIVSESFTSEDQQALVRMYINNTLSDLIDQLSLPSDQAQPSITLRCRANPTSCVFNQATGALETRPDVNISRTYSWPGSTAYESWKFTVIIRVLAIIDQALHTGQLISKRGLYYVDPAYFRSQNIVNDVIDDLACTIGVDRAAMNIEAAGKGLIAGSFCLKRDSQIVLDARSTSEDTMIPRIQDHDEVDISSARWILVVEKEAVFHRLVRSNYHGTAVAGQGVLITGKGYPDICTREFIRKLYDVSIKNNRPLPRVYALVDGDPHGVSIMSTYKYGSLAHQHENARLTIPHLRWLGLKISDAITNSNVSGSDGLLPLSPKDRRKIIAMLRSSPVLASDGPEIEWRTDLQQMLMLNVKAEIEMLYDRDGGLGLWIDRKMFQQE